MSPLGYPYLPSMHKTFFIPFFSLTRMLTRSSRLRCSFYELLKVPKTSSDEEIKKAYKAAALEHHPDRGGNSDKFKEISHAYSVLSDPAQRRVYDQFGEAGLNGRTSQEPEDPMDIFSQVFGGRGRRAGGRN